MSLLLFGRKRRGVGRCPTGYIAPMTHSHRSDTPGPPSPRATAPPTDVRRRGAHHRHLLQAELRRRGTRSARTSPSSPTPEVRARAGFRACLRCRPDEIGRDARGGRRGARAARGGEERPARRARRPRRLRPAPFPPAVQARHRRHPRRLRPRPPARAPPTRSPRPERHRRDLCGGLFRPRAASTRARSGSAWRPAPGRRGGAGETIRWTLAADQSRPAAGRRDRQGPVPRVVRRGRRRARSAAFHRRRSWPAMPR